MGKQQRLIRTLVALGLAAGVSQGFAQEWSGMRRTPEANAAERLAPVVQPASARRVAAGPAVMRTVHAQDPRTAVAEELPPQPPSEGPSATVNGLTLDDIEQLTLENHPGIAELAARVEAARGFWLQAGLAPNPLVGYSGQQIGSRGLAEQDGVVVQQEIVRGGKLRLSRAVAEQEIQRVEMEFSTEQMRALTVARKAYYDAMVAQKRAQFNDQLVEIGARGVQVAESLLKAKEIGRTDLLQARIVADQARILQTNSRNRVIATWRSLAASTGVPELPPQPLNASLNALDRTYDWDETIQRLLGSSPELATAIATAERARATIDRARVEYVPNLTIQGIVQRDAAIRSTDGALQVTMPIPVFNRNQGNVRAAESELIAAENAIRRVENSLQSRLAPVYERYANAKQQVEKYETEILPNAQETLDLAQAGFQAGEIGYLNLLTAQRTFYEMNVAHLDALRDLWNAIWDMEGLLTDSTSTTIQ
ncbi:MAG: TolC family protein [Pirellulales bacterium]